MIASVHLSPVLTIPVAILAACVVTWYWRRLGGEGVPAARQRIRRTSIFFLLLSLPAFVRGLSFLDPGVDKQGYVIVWSVAIMLLLILILIACIDGIMTMSMRRNEYQEELSRAGVDIAKAIREHRRNQATDRTDGSGEDTS